MEISRRFALVIACTLAGCHADRSVGHQIGRFIATKCADTWPCQVDLRNATQFQWDQLYVFKYTASKAEIEEAIRSTVSDYSELSTYFVFMYGGKPIRIESEPTHVEHLVKNELVFQMPDGALYRTFAAGTIFEVTQEQSGAGPYYLLRPK